MIHIFKNLNFGGLLALVAGVVLMVSWTSFRTTSAVEWYEVSDNGPNPNDKEIVGTYPTGAPGSECERDNGQMCALPITRLNYTGPITDLQHANELASDGLIEVGQPLFRLPQ